MQRRYPVFLVLLTMLCDLSPARAVNYFWQNAVGGAFDEPSNWSPLVPQGPGGPNDTTHFDLGVAPSNRYVVTDAGRENDRLIVHDDSLELTIFINHALLSTGGNDPSLVVGAANGDTGDLILSSGGSSVLETQVTRIANLAGSTGVVRVSDLEWNGGNLRVGHAGTGTLTIDDDSMVSSTNASIGHLAGSTGTATVQGGGSWTMSGDLLIGREGTGSLIITNGSSVTSADGSIGSESTGDGSVVLAGLGAIWTNTNSLTVGESGDGTLTIGSSADANNVDAFVGRLPGSSGHVSVSFGDWTTTGRMSIGGDSGTGVAGGTGAVEISGGRVTVDEDITLFINGDLTIDGGAFSVATVNVQAGGEFNLLFGLLQVEEFNASLRNERGVLATRSGSDSISINGTYIQEERGTLVIKITGAAASNLYDSVDVATTAYLDGELQIQLVELVEPSSSDVYTILESIELIGSFENAVNGQRLFDTSHIGSFIVNYGIGSPFDPDHVVLTSFLPAGPPGDYNQNGVVDAADYILWRNTLGQIGTGLPADGDDDGEVDPGDFDFWRARFGNTAGSGTGASGYAIASADPPSAAVPEPPSGWLAIIGAANGRWKRRRVASAGSSTRRRLRRTINPRV